MVNHEVILNSPTVCGGTLMRCISECRKRKPRLRLAAPSLKYIKACSLPPPRRGNLNCNTELFQIQEKNGPPKIRRAPDRQKSRFTTAKNKRKKRSWRQSKAQAPLQRLIFTIVIHHFPCAARDSQFSANKSPTVPTYADGALLTKCNVLFCSQPACQSPVFDTPRPAENSAGLNIC